MRETILKKLREVRKAVARAACFILTANYCALVSNGIDSPKTFYTILVFIILAAYWGWDDEA